MCKRVTRGNVRERMQRTCCNGLVQLSCNCEVDSSLCLERLSPGAGSQRLSQKIPGRRAPSNLPPLKTGSPP